MPTCQLHFSPGSSGFRVAREVAERLSGPGRHPDLIFFWSISTHYSRPRALAIGLCPIFTPVFVLLLRPRTASGSLSSPGRPKML